MCISVDYVLVPRDDLDTFVDLASRHMSARVPGYAASDSCTGIITERHLDRLTAMRQQAVDAGYRVVDTEPDMQIDRTTRQMPLSLVIDPGDELDLMREEVFGPLLPVKPYDGLDDAIAHVNAGERPLGLYVFGEDEAATGRVLAATTSGGACVNTCAMQGAVPSLGFGGSGQSGTGRHHGIEGFREFSNPRGLVVRGEGDLNDAFFAPYGDTLAAITDMAFDQTQD